VAPLAAKHQISAPHVASEWLTNSDSDLQALLTIFSNQQHMHESFNESASLLPEPLHEELTTTDSFDSDLRQSLFVDLRFTGS
jgi:hypothetical protein